MNPEIKFLIEKGVKIPCPDSVQISRDVDLENISGNGVILYPGTKIFGKSTFISKGVKLGYEGPVTIDNCQLGPDVELKGGFFTDAVFLEKASTGLGAHVRKGTILEEEASIAHTVGLKQTILLPFVTLGSLINFCDCLMAGGTDRKNHSEVGSSYIHFNYSPNQDKATASLIGDVPRGVMLKERPIFLGGQGGLVGPCRIAFGTVIAAGSIYRKDQLKPDRLVFAGMGKGGSMAFMPGLYRNIKRILLNNVIYIGNLIALKKWATHVRSVFICDDFPKELQKGLVEKISMGIDERIKRLEAVKEKMPFSIKVYKEISGKDSSDLLIKQKNEFYEKWDEAKKVFYDMEKSNGNTELMDSFIEKIETRAKNHRYIDAVKNLEHEEAAKGTAWLESIIDMTVENFFEKLPSLAI